MSIDLQCLEEKLYCFEVCESQYLRTIIHYIRKQLFLIITTRIITVLVQDKLCLFTRYIYFYNKNMICFHKFCSCFTKVSLRILMLLKNTGLYEVSSRKVHGQGNSFNPSTIVYHNTKYDTNYCVYVKYVSTLQHFNLSTFIRCEI